MRRVLVAFLLAGSAAFGLGGDASGPLVGAGSALSASALRSTLDARADARDRVSKGVIEGNRERVLLRDRVAALEQAVEPTSTVSLERGAFDAIGQHEADDDEDPWADANIVAGGVASAAALNDVFSAFVADVTTVRTFQAFLVEDLIALAARIETLEALAGIGDPPITMPLQPSDEAFTVPHVFIAGSVMLARAMNANLQAIDGALAEAAERATAALAFIALLNERVDALWPVFDPQPTFTWRIGTWHDTSGLVRTEAHFIYRRVGPFEPFTITVTGPDDFTRSTTITSSTAASSGWFESLLPSGTYTAETTYDGLPFSLPIAFDADSVLERPEVTVEASTTSEVVVTVGRTEGAQMYHVMLLDDDGLSVAETSEAPFSESTRTITFTGLDLDPSRSYDVSVGVSSVPALWSPTLVPQQADRAFSRSDSFSPSADD